MTQSENEIKNLSQPDSQKKSSQPKSNKKSVQKDIELDVDGSKQEKKKMNKVKKSDDLNNVEEKAKISKDIKSADTKIKSKKLSQSDNKELKKNKIDDSKDIANNSKVKVKKLIQTDVEQSEVVSTKSKKTSSESDKKEKSTVSQKNKKSNTDDNIKKENKNVMNESSQREDTSQLIINFFTNIQNDLRAIREHLVPNTKPDIPEVKKVKRNKKVEDLSISKQEVKVENKVDSKNEGSKKENKVDSKTEGSTSTVVYDDEFYLSKIKSKYEPEQEFTANDARNIWITSIGRLSTVKWNDILMDLSKKNKIVFVDEVKEKKRYKLAQ